MTKETKTEAWEKKLYDIVGEVKIPNHKDWGGGEEMSLFDITMDEKSDEEGIILCDNLKSFISSLLSSQKAELIKKIEGKKKAENLPPDLAGNIHSLPVHSGYNQALSEVINLLKEEN